MKKILTLTLTALSVIAYAQDNDKIEKVEKKIEKKVEKQIEKDVEKRQEIIISNNGKDGEVTVKFNGDNVTINGKDMAEYKDKDITIRSRKMAWSDRDGAATILHLNDLNGDLKQLNGELAQMHNFNFDHNFNWNDGEDVAVLGVTTEKADGGAKVQSVAKGSAAEKAGLKEGDVITGIDDAKVESPEDLTEAITSQKPDEEVTVKYARGKKKSSAKAKLGKRSARTLTYAFPNTRQFYFDMPDGERARDAARDAQRNFDRQLRFYEGQPSMGYGPIGGGKLGVKVEDIEKGDGVKVIEVEEGSKAEKAGIKVGDIITEVDGNSVKNTTDARINLAITRLKDTYNVKLTRDGKEMEVTVPKTIRTAEL